MHYYLDTAGLQDFAQKLTVKNKTLFAVKSLETDVEELRNAVGSPLVAETVASMTDTDKIYVYVGSEPGYTSGNWYYYDGSAWQSGGVYNSTAFVTDTTLTVSGDAADAKATGDAIDDLKTQITKFLENSAFDFSAITPNTGFSIGVANKWITGNVYKTYNIPLTEEIVNVEITAGQDGGIVAFLNSYSPVFNETPDFATGYESRIVLASNEKRSYAISGNMHYLWTLLQNANGDRTPSVTLNLIKTDKTLTGENIPADAKATGDAINTMGDTLKADSLMLRTGYCINIDENTDYNTLTTPGNYRCLTASVAVTLSNCPITTGHRITVATTTGSNYIYQIIFTSSPTNPSIYMRYGNETAWTEWARILTSEESRTFRAYITNEANRVSNRVRNWQTGNSITFIAVSDMHYKDGDETIRKAITDMGNGIKEIANQIHIDFYASFGDEIYRLSTGAPSDSFELGQKEIIAATKILNDCFSNNKQIRLIGNHDPNAEGTTGYFTANQLAAYTSIYSNFLNKYEEFPAGGIGYYDFERQKIRLIVLNTSLYEQSSQPTQHDTQYSFGNRQAYWLCQTLDLSAKANSEDWQIIIMSHVNIDNTQHATTIGKHSAVIKAYEDGTAWSLAGYSYDFSGKNSAKIAALLNGHWHQYRVKNLDSVTSSGDITETLSSSNLYIPNALPDRDYESMDGVTYTKTAGTATSTAFQVITIDPDNKVIIAHHYGAGIDIIMHYAPEAISASETLTTSLSSPVWNTNDATIATVSGGVVTPVANGNTMIWCKSSSDNYIEVWNISVSV